MIFDPNDTPILSKQTLDYINKASKNRNINEFDVKNCRKSNELIINKKLFKGLTRKKTVKVEGASKMDNDDILSGW